jgi:hypothetical protein
MSNMEDNKFASPVTCQMVVDDQSIMKSSPNSQPNLSTTLAQLTNANCHMEMEDSSVIKNEEAATNFVLPYMQ